MNFKDLDDLIHSGVKEIVLDSDIVLDDGEESQYLAGIKIDVDDLIIDGNGYAISAERKTRIFEVTGKNITIENIILKNGFAKKDGGAIYNCGGELSVSGTTLTENTARRGGAISNNEGLLTVFDSALTGNKLRNIYTGKLGGAIFNSGGNLTVYDSIFTENTAGLGGAIFNGNGEYIIRDDPPGIFSGPLFNGGGGELMIFDSIFTENTAAGGGAIFNSGGELTVSDSALAGNTARDSYGGGIGGAIFNDCGTFTVSDSVLTGNEVQDSYMVGRGGAIFHLRGNFKVFNCDFSNNKSSNSIIENDDSLQIFNSNFKSNHASNIILNWGHLSNLGISKGEFKDNDINESLIYNLGKSCTIKNTVFKNKISDNIINKSDLILISPKIKDGGKTILNEKFIIIIKSSEGLEDKIYGDGVVKMQ